MDPKEYIRAGILNLLRQDEESKANATEAFSQAIAIMAAAQINEITINNADWESE